MYNAGRNATLHSEPSRRDPGTDCGSVCNFSYASDGAGPSQGLHILAPSSTIRCLENLRVGQQSPAERERGLGANRAPWRARPTGVVCLTDLVAPVKPRQSTLSTPMRVRIVRYQPLSSMFCPSFGLISHTLEHLAAVLDRAASWLYESPYSSDLRRKIV